MGISEMENLSRVAQRRLGERRVGDGDAVMFDIDDTLWEVRTGKRIEPMLDLLYTSRMLGYSIVIITARPSTPDNQRWTIQQLHQMGVVPDHIAYCPPEVKDDAKDAYTQQKGLRFILSVGDQWTDLGNSKWWLKLPAYNDPRMGGNF